MSSLPSTPLPPPPPPFLSRRLLLPLRQVHSHSTLFMCTLIASHIRMHTCLIPIFRLPARNGRRFLHFRHAIFKILLELSII